MTRVLHPLTFAAAAKVDGVTFCVFPHELIGVAARAGVVLNIEPTAASEAAVKSTCAMAWGLGMRFLSRIGDVRSRIEGLLSTFAMVSWSGCSASHVEHSNGYRRDCSNDGPQYDCIPNESGWRGPSAVARLAAPAPVHTSTPSFKSKGKPPSRRVSPFSLEKAT